MQSTSGWASPDLLRQVFASDELIAQLAALEASVEFEDAAAVHAQLVNTALSAHDPISRWVRYREAYSPALVEIVLESMPPEDGPVLDPMCGSGSTQVAAQKLGLPSVGFDVSPYAVLVSRMKTSPLSDDELEAIEWWLTQDLESTRAARAPQDQALATFFPRRNLDALRALRTRLDADWTGHVHDFLHTALLSIVEACSNRRKDGNGLMTRPSKVDDVFALFREQARVMAEESRRHRDEKLVPSTSRRVSAVGFDRHPAVDEIGLREQGAGAVVFSPPYANSFDYFESYKLELLITGLIPIDEFQAQRKQLVRSYRQSGSLPPSDLPLVELVVREVEIAVVRKEELTGARDQRTRLVPNLLRGYFDDMREVLRSCAAVALPGARIHVVVDQSAYAGIAIPTDLLLADIGTGLGLEFERLTHCRRAKTSGQQLRLQPLLADLLRETIVTLRVP